MTTLGIRYQDWQLSPHGTLAAARRHYRDGEKPCRACKQAEQRDWAERGETYNARARERYAQARAAGMSAREARRYRGRGAAA
jgi:hypothetical protein